MVTLVIKNFVNRAKADLGEKVISLNNYVIKQKKQKVGFN